MTILALDTSSDRLLVGLADGTRVRAEYNGSADRRHSEAIVSAIDTVLRVGDITPDELDALAVMSGPGSFTGLRVGIATALGLAQAWRKPILSVGNFELARIIWADGAPPVAIVIHCRGEEFFVSERSNQVELLQAADIAGRNPSRSFVGPGAERLARALEQRSLAVALPRPATWSAGEMAGAIAANTGRFAYLDPINLDVNYVIKSQPEIRREQGKVRIDDLTPEDLAGVIEIEREAFSDPWERASFEADIDNKHVITLAARSDGSCVGYLSCIALEDYGYIANVAVHKDFRSRGVGQQILAELLNRLGQRGIADIVLDVRVSNTQAIKFYEKYGFQVLTRRKGFYSKPPEDSLTMLRIGKK